MTAGAACCAPAAKACPVKSPWLRRLGFFGFMFFLIKGLLWLAIPGGIVMFNTCSSSETTIDGSALP